MKKIELLAPAGNLEKAKIALTYGADAVYVGGKMFSLRARASNFTVQDIKELTNFAHERNKKVYVTMNILPHDEDLAPLSDYLKQLEKANVDAIITSSLTIVKTCEAVAPKIERHISTQMSITNSSAISFWKEMGASRVVLARENTLDEIKEIAEDVELELEVFIHGGMCASYSGRCVLSNHFTDRDANRGGCAHSCRWNYHLYDGTKRITKKEQFFNIGSKDLMGLRAIPTLIESKVASLKIEGRMKSLYYLATVVKCYRNLIDLYYEKGKIEEADYQRFEKEIGKAENRLTACGFFNGLPTITEQLYDTRTECPTQEFVASVISYDEDSKIAVVEQRNYFTPVDTLEVFGPKMDNKEFTPTKIYDHETKELLDAARHPLQLLEIPIPFHVEKDDMIRKVK